DAFSDNEYIIYNDLEYPFQAKILMQGLDDDPDSYNDAYYMSEGYILYDFVWLKNKPSKPSKNKILQYVEKAIINDIDKVTI
ncbi:MAG: hypothetical protein AAF195_01235, partial [Pseudomonadota bacterium]